MGSCLIYVICVCSVRLLPPVVCRRAHVLFTLFVFVRFVFYLQLFVGGSCLIYVICVCSVRLLPPVVCRRAHVLFTLFVFFRFVFYLHLFVRGLMSYLRYLCLVTYSGVGHILCCVLFVCVLFPV